MLDAYEARIVPDAMLGRVSSSINFLCGGLLWVGPLAAGLLAGGVGAVGAFAACGAAFAATALWCQAARPLHLLDDDPHAGRAEF